MTPNEIKEIIRVVVDYGWPWQWLATNGEWVTSVDQSLDNLLDEIVSQPYGRSDNRPPPYVRLDPNHEWDWPVETREGMPVWVWDRVMERWFCFDSTLHAQAVLEDCMEGPCVAPHPLKPNEPPPSDRTPEGRRVLS